VGGNDLTQQDFWQWSTAAARDGGLFWANGLPVPGRYENWGPDAPGAGDCMQLNEDGTWSDSDCGTSRGFVCEQPFMMKPPFPGPVRICDFLPVPCDGFRPDLDGPCVDEDDEFPSSGTAQQNRIQAEQIAAACTLNCTSEGDPDCATSCTGFARVPPAVAGCIPNTPEEKAFCDLNPSSVHPTATCSVENPNTCPAGTVCGRRIECAALFNNEPRRCTPGGNECDPGHHCGIAIQVCIDPSKTSKCDDTVGDECVGLCFGSFGCGAVHEDCAANDLEEFPNHCQEILLCEDEGSTVEDTNPISDPNSNLTTTTFPAGEIFPETEQPLGAYGEAKPPDCGGENEDGTQQPDCNFDIGDHPWCNYIVGSEDKPAAPTVSDTDPAFNDKQGTGGGSGPIRFDFDPNLSISYDVKEPLLPLGDGRFEAHALASATATAHFNFDFLGIGGDVKVLDARGAVDVDRCGLNTDARLALFGFDFLPVLLGEDTHELLTSVDTPEEQRQRCTDAIDDFVATVERAEKAMRDAQEMIRQQRALVLNDERLSPDFCNQVLGAASRGLPADFPTPDAPFTDCGDLSPEETINLFVRYYRSQVTNLISEQARLLLAGLPTLPQVQPDLPEGGLGVTIPFLDRVDQSEEVNEARRETQKILSFTFLIGPIPVNLSVEAFVQYGVAGALTMRLSPDRLVDAYDDANSQSAHELAFVDATITPFAGAGVSIFVGVGFSFGPLEAKLGISGDVSLGLVSLPLYAGAGIGVRAEPDERSLPDDMKDIVKSANALFPTGPAKKYRFEAMYKFGATASISDILSGDIGAMLRVKFFFFSKKWRKRIIKFGSPFPRIDLKLINEGGTTEFADATGLLGRIRMPLQFVDFKDLETPPPLPPLPGTGGTGGMGGAGGSAGAGGSTGGAGNPGIGGTVSLRVAGNDTPRSAVLQAQTDPRLKPFDFGRVDQLFYDGYCACSDPGDPEATCRADLDCCGTSFCVLNDVSQVSRCVDCVTPTSRFSGGGQRCENTSECCQSDPQDRPVSCYPLAAGGANKYCQACRGQGEPVIDSTPNDGNADFGECCANLNVFRPPLNNVPQAGAPICSGCRAEGQSCNVASDCCPASGNNRAFCRSEPFLGYAAFTCGREAIIF
jgi:hypothetical protein